MRSIPRHARMAEPLAPVPPTWITANRAGEDSACDLRSAPTGHQPYL